MNSDGTCVFGGGGMVIMEREKEGVRERMHVVIPLSSSDLCICPCDSF